MKNQKKFVAANVPQILRSPRWLAMMFLLPLLAMVHFAMAAPVDVVTAPQLVTQSAISPDKFDHVKTGFNLTGSHASARCTSCHINNVFKGAPRDCATCHRVGNLMSATAKPTNHVTTNAQCDTCHKTSVWTPAVFSHVGMSEGACATCHNGTTAQGKSRSHIPVPTAVSCDNCHKPVSWLQVTFSHKGIDTGCSDCHTGQVFSGMPTPKAKPNNHMVTALDCAQCHTTTSFAVIKPGSPVAIPTGHIPTGAQVCSACHKGTSFLPGIMNHVGISGSCESCHNGTSFVGVTPRGKLDAVPTHISTSLPCESCHTNANTGFKLAPGTVLPMPAGHLPSQMACSTCHTAGYGPGSGVMSHLGISSGCATCHDGQTFSLGNVRPLSKPLTTLAHIPTTAACEFCHSPSKTSLGGFSGTKMNHSGMVSNCAQCHNDGMSFAGVTPKRKEDVVGHMSTQQDCSSCHKSTSTFVGATGVPLPLGHMPTAQACSTCHRRGYAVGLTDMNHVGIAGNCNTCHDNKTFTVNGVSYQPKPKHAAHITTQNLDCSSCHTSTATFTGAISTVLPPNHLPTTRSCTTCHIGASVSMSHAGIVSNCVQCHNGQTFATNMKPVSKANFPTHVGTSLDCASCHYPNSNGFTSFAGATAGSLPLNHLPTSQPCSTCHTSFGAGSGLMKHTGIVSGCANCHNGQTFAVGMKPVSKPTGAIPHVPTSLSCETCHSISAFNSFAGTTMKHTGITGGCADCHGAGKNFVGGIVTYPSNHVPTTLVTNGALCETCHSKTNFTTFSGAPMNHTGITTGCKACHSNTPFAGGTPLFKPSNHIPEAQLLGGAAMDCNFCHKLTTIGGFKTLSVTSTIMHNGSQGKGSGQCTGCHLSGTAYLGVQGRKSLTHEKPGHTDCSDSGCHKPLGNEGTAYQSW